jgi:hypothetical protein
VESQMRENEGQIHNILKWDGIGGIEYGDLIQQERIATRRSAPAL